jgi:hypothetical protein
MLQHQMLTSQMFTFMSGCLGQLFQQSGLQLPQPPTTAELQADPTAPLPPPSGFVNVRGTSDDDTSGSGHHFLSGSTSDDHSCVVTAGVSTYHRSTCLRDTSSHHSAQSIGVFTASDIHHTEGRGVGTGGLLSSSDHGADLVSSCLRHYSSCS